ncbi:copper resistance protein CopC [Nocardia sp. alder85J]|uniref:copper resistance protein CopC n=1 Tax=Nocardia sp. alder85J TaxID=2862949 RepID=UPI001CD1EA32|nr:copper resistance protein CopC [Nocardia sp. alder85J]MCX4098545.1 copper resistance protein CopC [Nocardia sp. alder85J]
MPARPSRERRRSGGVVVPAVRRWRWCLVVLLAVAGPVWAAGVASAHAVLVSTTPDNGTHVDRPPSRLQLQLAEPVTLVPGSAQLIDSGGTRFELTAAALDDGRRRVVLTPARTLPDGAYLATARVVSADTHVVSLSLQFTVGATTAPGRFATTATPGTERYLDYPSKGLTYLGLLLSAGLWAAARWAWPAAARTARFRTVHRIGSGVFLLGFACRFLVLVTQQSGPAGLSAASARTVLGAPHGIALAVAVVVAIVAPAVPARYGRAVAAIAAAQAITAILAVTLDGHGGSFRGGPWTFTGTLLHVYGVTVWLGGVAVIALVPRGAPHLRRWHAVAVGHVAAAVTGGVTLAVVQVRPPAALVHTTYGLVLVAKALLAVAVAGFGYLSYRWFRRISPREGRPWTLLPEAGLAVLALALTSVLTTLAPAKDVYTTDIATALDFGPAQRLHIGIDSIRHGPQQLTLTYVPASTVAARPDSATVSVDLSSVSANVARLPVALTPPVPRDGALVWRSDRLIVPAAGQWRVTVRFDDGQGPRLASFFYKVL